MESLIKIQSELNAPKNQFNKFGNYYYRSCEDILSAVKPLLAKYNCLLRLTDEVVEVGGRVYVKATAIIHDLTNCGSGESVTAYARESETRKGMDDSQITGSASSYARKYALNGLFLIDDVKDADSTNTHDKIEKPKAKGEIEKALSAIKNVKTKQELAKIETLLQERSWTDDEIVKIEATLADMREAL